jgi:hypothetical protein
MIDTSLIDYCAQAIRIEDGSHSKSASDIAEIVLRSALKYQSGQPTDHDGLPCLEHQLSRELAATQRELERTKRTADEKAKHLEMQLDYARAKVKDVEAERDNVQEHFNSYIERTNGMIESAKRVIFDAQIHGHGMGQSCCEMTHPGIEQRAWEQGVRAMVDRIWDSKDPVEIDEAADELIARGPRW